MKKDLKNKLINGIDACFNIFSFFCEEFFFAPQIANQVNNFSRRLLFTTSFKRGQVYQLNFGDKKSFYYGNFAQRDYVDGLIPEVILLSHGDLFIFVETLSDGKTVWFFIKNQKNIILNCSVQDYNKFELKTP